jgi:hypothetical protein
LSSPAEPDARPKLYRALRRALDREGSDRAVVVLALVLLCFGLDGGLSADDYVHSLIARGSQALPGFARHPLDLYRFADGTTSAQLMREGVLSWWEDPRAKIAFFRPLSALTHVLDYRLFPDRAWLMHLHSIAWSALLLGGVLALYRALLASRFVCALAVFIYALDDARGWLVSWVAGRNAVIATALSVWALWFHLRWRAHGDRRAAWIAPVLLLLALLAGEGAAAILGYLFAYAMCLDRGSMRERALSLAPYALVLVPWRLWWTSSGYGVAFSGLYVDPLATPLDFARAVMERGPLLLFSQMGGAWTDIWNMMFVFPFLQRTLWLVACAAVLALGYALWPLVRRDATVRFAALGSSIALLPACSAFLADRLLTWIAIGAAIALAKLIEAHGEQPELLRRAPLRALVIAPLMLGLLFVKTVVDPIQVAWRSRGNLVVRENLDRAHAGVPSDPSIASRRVVYLNPPGVPLAAYLPVERAALGIPRPKSQVYLATGEADLRLTRVDARSLRVRQRGGFLQNSSAHLFRDPRTPSRVGTRVQLGGLSVEVTALMPDGRPAEILARFDDALESPALCWLRWRGRSYEPFTPPAIGGEVIIPALDLPAILVGHLLQLPFDSRMPPAIDPHWSQPNGAHAR